MAKRSYAARMPADERREQALDAALRLVAEHGHGAVSMEAVARECDVAKPVLYELWPNAGELLAAVLARETDRFAEGRAALFVAGGDPIDALRRFLEDVRAHPDTWRAMLMPADGLPPAVRDAMEASRADSRRRIARVIEAREGSGAIDVELAAHAALALLEHAARLQLTEPESMTPERLARFARALMR